MAVGTSPLEAHLQQQLERSRSFFWNRVRWEVVAGYLPEAEPFELVDVGAGPGFLGDFLRARRPQAEYGFVEPLDSLETSLEQRFGAAANRRAGDSFGTARYVTLLDVLEHQEDDRDFLAGLAAKMAPGSLLLLTVPAMPSLWSAWDEALGHYRRYTKRSLVEAVGGLPFEVEEVGYLFPELLPLGWVRRVRLRGGGGGGDAPSAEFPDLSPRLNEVLYRVSSASAAARRRWPAGTSVFAALRRN
ncbi:MAG: methyltransferase domain-containing protein [Solirubrobacterales bacterium]